jgi:proteasome lid subunit RPN8/RPN11
MVHSISLSGSATDVIIHAAIQGYEAPYKEERLGILLGQSFQGIARVERAIIYQGGSRTRTEASVDPHQFKKRVSALQNDLGLVFLGSFHTHNEIADSISSAPSQADKIPLCENPPSLVELIAAIWASNGRVQPSQMYLQCGMAGYRIRMAGYGYQQGFPCLPVSSVTAQSA